MTEQEKRTLLKLARQPGVARSQAYLLQLLDKYAPKQVKSKDLDKDSK